MPPHYSLRKSESMRNVYIVNCELCRKDELEEVENLVARSIRVTTPHARYTSIVTPSFKEVDLDVIHTLSTHMDAVLVLVTGVQ